MQPKSRLLLLSCLLALATSAQEVKTPLFNIGDAAPPLRLRTWLKGSPIAHLAKGKIYVLEFWATWCHPCKVAMPHLSDLAREYKGKVTFIGVDIYENKTTPLKAIQHFVDSMDSKMDYDVATEDSDLMSKSWLDASAEQGIPKTYVVDAGGLVAWIGQPRYLARVLPSIVGHTWDSKAALVERVLNKRLDSLDREESFDLAVFNGSPAKPDSILAAVQEVLRKEPRLKYRPVMVANTFSALLETNPHEAYLFGEGLLAATGDDLPFDMIYKNVEQFPSALPAELYRLAAEAFQAEIKVDSEYLDLPDMYHRMAEMDRRAKNPTSSLQ